jgi:hypothetical protein
MDLGTFSISLKALTRSRSACQPTAPVEVDPLIRHAVAGRFEQIEEAEWQRSKRGRASAGGLAAHLGQELPEVRRAAARAYPDRAARPAESQPPWASAKHGAADGAKAGHACVVCIRHVSPSDPKGLPSDARLAGRQTLRVWERYTRLTARGRSPG